MILTVGLMGILFGWIIGWVVRDFVADRPPSRRKLEGIDDYWRSWPAMLRDLRRNSKP